MMTTNYIFIFVVTRRMEHARQNSILNAHSVKITVVVGTARPRQNTHAPNVHVATHNDF